MKLFYRLVFHFIHLLISLTLKSTFEISHYQGDNGITSKLALFSATRDDHFTTSSTDPTLNISPTSIIDDENDQYFPLDIRIAMTLIYFFLSVIGIFGNILIIIVVFKVSGMKTPTNLYLVSMAVSDCIFFVATLPTEISYIHVEKMQFIFGYIGCAVFTYIPYLAINTSSMCITAFTIERFVGICYPLKARNICTRKRAKNIILGIWIFSIIYNCPWIYFATLSPFKNGQICTFMYEKEWAYKLLYFADMGLFYVIPMILNFLIYGRITYTLSSMKREKSILRRSFKKKDFRQSKKTSQSQVDSPVSFASIGTPIVIGIFNTKEKVATKYIIKILKILLFLILILPIIWVIVRIIIAYCNAEKKLITDLCIFFAKILMFINCAINPVLYYLMSGRFRSAFKELLFEKKLSPIFTLPKESIMMKDYRNGDTHLMALSEEEEEELSAAL